MLDSDLEPRQFSAGSQRRSLDVIKPNNPNSEFELGGINHVALVCSDMERTVDFYTNVLGMPLVKSLDLPGDMGQHFFFDAGNGDCVAFFWFRDAPDGVPGVSSPGAIPGIGDIVSATGSMNHLALHVPAEKFDEYRQKLKDKGVRVGPVLNHDTSARQVSPTLHPGVYVRSFYFFDPDGITLEFACWTKEFTDDDTHVPPKTAADRRPAQAPLTASTK
jgi:catechol 2,3-dioxygenase-like lactoylglutathione lyase family enzyme